MGSPGKKWDQNQMWRGLRRIEAQQAVFVVTIHKMINGSEIGMESRLN
jgi:hypothetical protein